MTVTKTGVVIAIWVIVGVLLVAVLIVAVILGLRYQRNRSRRRYLTSTEEADLSSNDEPQWSRKNFYPGYERLTSEDVTTDPAAGVYGRPRVVHVRRAICDALSNTSNTSRAAYLLNAPCDILVNVFYVDPSTASASRLQTTMLGSDGFYSAAFLLYTSPLEFIAPGTYVIQAHTVYHSAKAVGSVHQFVFVVTDVDARDGAQLGATAGAITASGLQLMGGSPSGNDRSNTVDINLARHVMNPAQSGGVLVPSQQQQLQQPANGTWGAVPQNGLPTNSNSAVNQYAPSAAAPAVGNILAVYQEPLLPPRISPAEGSVTTRTPITISPNERSTTADQLRYSVDGSHPTVLYTGPFTLSLPPESILPSQRQTILVRALAVSPSCGFGRDGGISELTEAVLDVSPAGYSFYDPDVPAPAMRLRAVDATLYFDESANPPHCRTVYQLLYVNEVRRRKAKFSRRRCQLYERTPIPITDDVAMVYAWTVTEDEWERGGAGAGGGSNSVRNDGLVDSDDDYGNSDGAAAGYGGKSGGAYGRQLRSVATIYDCARAAAEQAKPSKKRMEQLNIGQTAAGGSQGMRLLPAPVVCVSCAEMEIAFDDAPANCVIAYTLNGTEPALYDVSPPACARPVASAATASAVRRSRSPPARNGSLPKPHNRRNRADDRDDGSSSTVAGDEGGFCTHRYTPGEHIRVTLLETDGVYVTARMFLPVYESGGTVVGSQGGQGGTAGTLVGYRFGNVFHRGFFFSD